MKRPVLEVSNLSVQRGRTRIIEDLNWRVEAGQHWVILGANGSGKTSLLSVLAGYLMPTAGEFAVLGQQYGEEDWRELRKQIGLVSSSVRQMMADSETALETVVSGKFAMIDFWGRMSRADQSRGARILRQVDCSYLAKRARIFLSQGERQRILIGRALMAQPKLLILDEPCAGLDPAAREHFLQFLQHLGEQKSAPTLVLVTHHVEEIMPVFSHVLTLRNGRVLSTGEKKSVLTSKLLSSAFGSPIRLKVRAERYQLSVQAASRTVM